MKIIFVEWYSYGNQDIIDAFREFGHEVVNVKLNQDKTRDDEEEINRLKTEFEKANGDLIFSFNYWPAVSLAAKELDMTYVSWVYNSPHDAVQSAVNLCKVGAEHVITGDQTGTAQAAAIEARIAEYKRIWKEETDGE